MKVFFTEQALQDVREISNFLLGEADDDVVFAFLDRIERIRIELSMFPQAGKVYEDLLPYIRSISFKPYILFYRIQNDHVEVVRVLHGARDVDSLFQEMVH